MSGLCIVLVNNKGPGEEIPPLLHMDNKLAYLAGLLDGEGCVNHHNHDKGRPKRFTMTIAMTTEPIIDWLVENFGGTKGPCKVKENYKPMWRWRIRCGQAHALFDKVEPMLLLKTKYGNRY